MYLVKMWGESEKKFDEMKGIKTSVEGRIKEMLENLENIQGLPETLCNDKMLKFLGNYEVFDKNVKEYLKRKGMTEINLPKSFNLAEKIRFALRKYFCHDLKNGKENEIWNEERGISFILEDENQTFQKIKSKKDLYNKQIDIQELNFEKEIDDKTSKSSQNKFKFTILFTKEFKKLQKIFELDSLKMLLSLTLFPFANFDSNTKGGCEFLTSWNEQFLLKTIQKEPKWFTEWTKNSKIPLWLLKLGRYFLEPFAEKHFFFDENKKKQLIYPFSWWDINVKESKFKGTFVDYFSKMNKEDKYESLLPKYSLSFIIQEITENDTLKEPIIFTIQNGLFPRGIPKLDLKFDLKGSSREVEGNIENMIENGGNGKVLKEKNIMEIFKKGIVFDNNEEYEKFIGMIKADSKFLSERNIIDYSLLLGVHFVTGNESKNEVKNGIKAKAIICTENSCEKKELILFYGIIDIFQNYSLRKQLKQKLLERKQGKENDLFPDEKILPMSVIEPSDYQERFVKFMEKLFKKD